MNAFLISPVLAYELRLRDKTLPFAFLASVLWLAFFQLLARRVWIVHAVMFPLYWIVGLDLYIIATYQTRLGSNMILTIVENFGDTRDFLSTDPWRTIGSTVLLVAVYGFCLWKIRDLRMTLPRTAALAPLAALAVVYLGVHHYVGWWSMVVVNDHNSPFGIFSQAYLTSEIHEEEVREREQAKSFHFGATRAAEPDQPETYVLVVGESARRHNWSLYGYGRETNPRLSKVDDLVVFKDAITQVPQTQFSVPLILTRGSIDDTKRTSRETSIVSLFHDVGFQTYWLSTQQRDTAMAAISRYTSEADVVRFFERRHDIVLVETVKEILASQSGQKKIFFTLHTLGSHFNLTSRYPREFAVFPDGLQSQFIQRASDSSTHAELLGAYDNTIVYTDYVLSQLIEVLRQRPGIKAMLYVPDHGDNLRDDDRNMFGHGHSNEYDLPIPMLFWFSPEYRQRFPEKIEAVRANASRPVNTRVVFYSLTDMAGAKIEDPELPRLSVFSSGFTNFKRMTFGRPQIFDFDEWLARTGTTIPVVTPPK